MFIKIEEKIRFRFRPYIKEPLKAGFGRRITFAVAFTMLCEWVLMACSQDARRIKEKFHIKENFRFRSM